LLKREVHLQQLVKELTFDLSNDSFLFAKLMKAYFGLGKELSLQDMSEFGLESSRYCGAVLLVNNELLIEVAL
jgi:hypothetical protein